LRWTPSRLPPFALVQCLWLAAVQSMVPHFPRSRPAAGPHALQRSRADVCTRPRL